MNDVTLSGFAWPRVAELLGAHLAPRSVATFPGVVLTWPERQALLSDNGGEFNLIVREGGGLVWELGFSVAYDGRDGAISTEQMAYRVACVLDGRQIDYQAKPTAETLPALVAAAARVEGEREPAPCFCTMRHGYRVGVVCIACQLGRGPLDTAQTPRSPVCAESARATLLDRVRALVPGAEASQAAGGQITLTLAGALEAKAAARGLRAEGIIAAANDASPYVLCYERRVAVPAAPPAPDYSGIDRAMRGSVTQCACERAAAWHGFEHAVRAGWRSRPEVTEAGILRHWTCPDCVPPEAEVAAPERALAVPLAFADRVRDTIDRGLVDEDLERSLRGMIGTDPPLGRAYLETAVQVASARLLAHRWGLAGPSMKSRKASAIWLWNLACKLGVRLLKPKMPRRKILTNPEKSLV